MVGRLDLKVDMLAGEDQPLTPSESVAPTGTRGPRRDSRFQRPSLLPHPRQRECQRGYFPVTSSFHFHASRRFSVPAHEGQGDSPTWRDREQFPGTLDLCAPCSWDGQVQFSGRGQVPGMLPQLTPILRPHRFRNETHEMLFSSLQTTANRCGRSPPWTPRTPS